MSVDYYLAIALFERAIFLEAKTISQKFESKIRFRN